ncbi:hypothetical protein IM40_01365 [Candidatus Paracaedimonas acanthamoebae]|nr:hypothetical protein IM40_01365 [Candidatus Paracaedimonas acanthamoebae]
MVKKILGKTCNKINIKLMFFMLLSPILTFSFAEGKGLTKEEIESYKALPFEAQPLVPLEHTFSFRGQRSTSYTLKAIENLTRSFLEQTGGMGINRNIGTAKMLAIINKTLDEGGHHLNEEEMDAYATSQLLKYLYEIKSPRAKTFYKALEACESKNITCEGIITFTELYGFIEKQKTLIYSKVKKPSQQQWKSAKPKIKL